MADLDIEPLLSIADTFREQAIREESPEYQAKLLQLEKIKRLEKERRTFRNNVVPAINNKMRMTYMEPFSQLMSDGSYGEAMMVYGKFRSEFGFEDAASDLAKLQNTPGNTTETQAMVQAKMQSLAWMTDNVPSVRQFSNASTEIVNKKLPIAREVWGENIKSELVSVRDLYNAAINGSDEHSKAAADYLIGKASPGRKADVAKFLGREYVSDPNFFGKDVSFSVKRDAKGNIIPSQSEPAYQEYVAKRSYHQNQVLNGKARNIADSIRQDDALRADFERRNRNSSVPITWDRYKKMVDSNRMQQEIQSLQMNLLATAATPRYDSKGNVIREGMTQDEIAYALNDITLTARLYNNDITPQEANSLRNMSRQIFNIDKVKASEGDLASREALANEVSELEKIVNAGEAALFESDPDTYGRRDHASSQVLSDTFDKAMVYWSRVSDEHADAGNQQDALMAKENLLIIEDVKSFLSAWSSGSENTRSQYDVVSSGLEDTHRKLRAGGVGLLKGYGKLIAKVSIPGMLVQLGGEGKIPQHVAIESAIEAGKEAKEGALGLFGAEKGLESIFVQSLPGDSHNVHKTSIKSDSGATMEGYWVNPKNKKAAAALSLVAALERRSDTRFSTRERINAEKAINDILSVSLNVKNTIANQKKVNEAFNGFQRKLEQKRIELDRLDKKLGIERPKMERLIGGYPESMIGNGIYLNVSDVTPFKAQSDFMIEQEKTKRASLRGSTGASTLSPNQRSPEQVIQVYMDTYNISKAEATEAARKNGDI